MHSLKTLSIERGTPKTPRADLTPRLILRLKHPFKLPLTTPYTFIKSISNLLLPPIPYITFLLCNTPLGGSVNRLTKEPLILHSINTPSKERRAVADAYAGRS